MNLATFIPGKCLGKFGRREVLVREREAEEKAEWNGARAGINVVDWYLRRGGGQADCDRMSRGILGIALCEGF